MSVSPEEGVDVSHHIRLGRGVRQDYQKNLMRVMRNFWVGRFLQKAKNRARWNGTMDFDGQAERLGLDTIGNWSGSLA